ncbi:hypothetical protein [Sphingomonas sp. LT1P40]|uniref:hypothetical protein n=1 Tax=Alteristakelama amylovorans TaxID=3096166 RepID=UPI002FC80C59
MAAITDKHGGGRNLWRIARWSAAAGLLTIPAIAMQFTEEVQWTASDFIVMGGLLAIILGAYEWLSSRSNAMAYRVAAGVTVLGVFLLIWLNLAVGIIGSENNDANLMFAGVIAVITGGACIAHFRAEGMGWTLIAAAVSQVVVGAIALIGDLGTDGRAWPRDVIVLSGFFTGLWLVAATLFRMSAKET